ncbi:MAG: hypothetical protein HQK50_09450 [Oligoflexia bacterium]|nr:hypothetical protein [Oligoflexia bacterium]MBF0365786.1 hypothetical protein [Oligoflexia bacterium]
MSTQKRSFEDEFFNRQWRSRIALTYVVICLFDFFVAPIVWATVFSITAWQPLTLQGGGTFHLSFGAILGVSAFSKSKEKIAELSSAIKEGA